MLKNLLFIVSILIMVATPAFGLTILPNDDCFLYGGQPNTNKNASRLAIQKNGLALSILEFDIPAGTAAGDISFEVFGGVDPAGAGWSPTQTMPITIQVGLYDFDETTVTWNNAGWLGGSMVTAVSLPQTIVATDTVFKWWTFPMADAINAGLAGQRVVIWMDCVNNTGGNPWAVFEDKEGSAGSQHGAGFGGLGFEPHLEIIPEPSAALLLLLGVPMLRRRRA